MISKIFNYIKNKFDKPNKKGVVLNNRDVDDKHTVEIAGIKWTKQRQDMVMQIMDAVPQDKRTYH